MPTQPLLAFPDDWLIWHLPWSWNRVRRSSAFDLPTNQFLCLTPFHHAPMAGFKTHISVSTALGCGYAAYGYVAQDLPPTTAVLGGALCGLSGMLPDLDSDYGVPLRETMAFTAALVPMLLIGHFETMNLSHDAMVLVAVSLYLFVRFGVTNIIRKHTVHRGMFHSIPAALIFAGGAFLLTATAPLPIRYYKAFGVLLGVMSHLLLDEIYSVELNGARSRLKKSFGTAVKLWGDGGLANLATYTQLAIIVVMILGEPSVMEYVQTRNPEFARRYQQLQQQFESSGSLSTAANEVFSTVRTSAEQFVSQMPSTGPPSPTAGFLGFFQGGNNQAGTSTQNMPPQQSSQAVPYYYPSPGNVPPSYPAQGQPATIQRDFETAQRPWPQYPQ